MSTIAKLKNQGLISQITSEDIDLDNLSYTFYAGFDPTADSLHVGHLFVLMMMKRLQDLGHTPIAVVGGATGMIGDPSGKSKERNLLDEEQIAHNVACVRVQIEKFIDLKSSGRLVNNMDWMKEFSLIPFLRDVGKNFRLSEMIAKESVQKRLDSEEGISFTEFTYQILQSYDFLHLYETYGCNLQIGGSDQWGNITAGTDLIRRKTGGSAFGITFPLIQGANGQKFGKTEQGTVWLDEKRTSPYQFYQFFLQTEDSLAVQYLRYFTLLSDSDIEQLEQDLKERPEARTAQKALALDITKRVHGEVLAQKAIEASQILFGAEITQMDDASLSGIFSDVPSLVQQRNILDSGELSLLDVLVEAKLVPSKGQGRQRIKGGGIYINNKRVDDENLKLGPNNLVTESTMVLRAGKKNYCLIRFN
ncbi:MAG: tyrosine--tRNA ligase [Candidatus Cloacimonetes bacterium]|nr:tyrosine--tRNA ligase [Candidatus Cloacimonadota bacterium]